MRPSINRILALGAALAAAVLAVPAAAQMTPLGEWQYAEGPENCRAYRSFGTPERRVLLQLRSFGPGSAIEVMVVSPDLPDDPHSVRPVEFTWDGGTPEQEQTGLLGSVSGIPTVTMLVTHRPAATFGFLFEEGRAWVSPLDRNSQSMQLRVIGGTPIELLTGSLAEPLDRLAQCDASLMHKWGWRGLFFERAASRPEMLDPQSWFYRGIVYPAVQNLKRISSILQLRLKIDAEGNVDECVVQSSPGSSLFGSKNCEGIRKVGRFKPATDAFGQPVDSYMQMSITFARYD